MHRYHFRRPKFIPLIMTLGAVAIMGALGIWQLERLVWKEHLLKQLAQAQQQSALTVLPPDAELPAHEFRAVTLKGVYEHDKEMHLAGRYHKTQFGYDLVTPFKLADGRVILINRGWVPAAKKLPETRPETQRTGTTTAKGMLRITGLNRRFTPGNQPQENIWFTIDFPQMQAVHNLTLVPAIINLVPADPQDETLPIPSGGVVTLRNDHLGYAITWFGIALAALVIFVVYHTEKRAA